MRHVHYLPSSLVFLKKKKSEAVDQAVRSLLCIVSGKAGALPEVLIMSFLFEGRRHENLKKSYGIQTFADLAIIITTPKARNFGVRTEKEKPDNNNNKVE